MKTSACFTQLCSGTGGEAAVLQEHRDVLAEGQDAPGGADTSPVGP